MGFFKKFDVYAAGLAIFAMFFGAGNVIFPLALGHYALDKTPYAILGLIITAVIMPFLGLLAMFLYQGDIKQFFGRIGNRLGLIMAFFIIGLLGPFGSTPRCIALAYSTFKLSFPSISPVFFSAVSCLIIYFLTYKKNRLLDLLGYCLTPLLVALLTLIVTKGFLDAPHQPVDQILNQSGLDVFYYGLKEGYNTMDLLAALFFAPLILSSLQRKGENCGAKNLFTFMLRASGIGALLLAIIYVCFSYLASFYAPLLIQVPSDQLLAAIAVQILGPSAGLIVGLIIVLACLTTAMALMAAFTSFLHKEIIGEKVSDKPIMVGALALTFIVATFEFQGISQFLAPVLQICYPILILLTALNIADRLYQLKMQLNSQYEEFFH